MRVALICPNPWSEFATAVACLLTARGFTPVGALTLPTVHIPTLVRKYRQSGGEFVRNAIRSVTTRSTESAQNPRLAKHRILNGDSIRTVRQCASICEFPLLAVDRINAPAAVAAIRNWEIDLLIYTGGGIVRQPLIEATRLGILNSHESLLPDARGMDAAEWSLLLGRPFGITVHYIDRGIDTGPILIRRPLEVSPAPRRFGEVRELLAELGAVSLADAVMGIADGSLRPAEQDRFDEDLQHYVMHDTLREHAQRLLGSSAES